MWYLHLLVLASALQVSSLAVPASRAAPAPPAPAPRAPSAVTACSTAASLLSLSPLLFTEQQGHDQLGATPDDVNCFNRGAPSSSFGDLLG